MRPRLRNLFMKELTHDGVALNLSQRQSSLNPTSVCTLCLASAREARPCWADVADAAGGIRSLIFTSVPPCSLHATPRMGAEGKGSGRYLGQRQLTRELMCGTVHLRITATF